MLVLLAGRGFELKKVEQTTAQTKEIRFSVTQQST